MNPSFAAAAAASSGVSGAKAGKGNDSGVFVTAPRLPAGQTLLRNLTGANDGGGRGPSGTGAAASSFRVREGHRSGRCGGFLLRVLGGLLSHWEGLVAPPPLHPFSLACAARLLWTSSRKPE